MNYDLFVIGGGSGGIATARRAAQYGAKVGLAESNRLGGTCVNRGCVPKKLMVYASHFASQLEDAQSYGWTIEKTAFDWQKMITAVNNEVIRLNGIYQRMLENSKVDSFASHAKFLDANTLQVGDKKITADKILIAVGGHAVKPEEIPGIKYAMVSDDIFNLTEQPKRIVVLGGGYIGCEFASILNGLGTEVTQVIRADKILRGFDDDIRLTIQEGMVNHGVNLLTKTHVLGIEKTEGGLKVTLKGDGDAQETIMVDAVGLAATGRKPNLTGFGLENTKVEVKNGAIAVNEWSQTAEEHIYAVGDCTDRVNLTPVAINEGRAFADTVFGGQPRTMSYDNIPTAVFTTPEAGTVGLTETEAMEKYGGDRIKIYRTKFRPMYYTLTGKDEKTMMKLVVDTETDQVLGVHVVGDHAAEMVQTAAIAVKMGAKKADFDATVGIHPTSAEELVTMR